MRGRGSRSELMYFNVWRQLAATMQVGDMEHDHRPGSPQAPRMYPGFPNVLFAGEQHEAFRELPPKAGDLAPRSPADHGPPGAGPGPGPPARGGRRGHRGRDSDCGCGTAAASTSAWTAGWSRTGPGAERGRGGTRQDGAQAARDDLRPKRELRGLAKYLEGTEHTASRAALLMTNDIRVADRARATRTVWSTCHTVAGPGS